MSILSVIKRVIIISEGYNKPVKDIEKLVKEACTFKGLTK